MVSQTIIEKGGERRETSVLPRRITSFLRVRGACVRSYVFSMERVFEMGAQALTYLAQDLELVRLGVVRVVGHPRPLQATVVIFVVHGLVGLLVLGDLRVCVRW